MGASASYSLMLRYLRDNTEGMTTKELAIALGVTPATTHFHIRNARSKGAVHIGRWQVAHAARAPVWAAGPGKDAKRPSPMTGKELSARYRKRNRALVTLKKRAKRGKLNVFSQVTL